MTAIDIDEQCIEATKENSTRNEVADIVDSRVANPGDLVETWPLVLANLELSIFLNCSHDIASRVEQGGGLYAAGLLTKQVEQFLGLFPEFHVDDRVDDEGWATIALRRKS